MSSLHETAYPRLRSTITDKELKEYYTPTPEELKLIASEKKPILRFGLILNLKLLQRLGYFVPLASASPSIMKHVLDAIGIKRPITLKQLKDYDRSGSRSRQQQLQALPPNGNAHESGMSTVAFGEFPAAGRLVKKSLEKL